MSADLLTFIEGYIVHKKTAFCQKINTFPPKEKNMSKQAKKIWIRMFP